MRTLNLALALGLGTLAMATTASTPAQSANLRYCVIQRGNFGHLECDYYTWNQCMASASGRGSCQENPIFSAQRPPYSNTYNPAQYNPFYQPAPTRVVRVKKPKRKTR